MTTCTTCGRPLRGASCPSCGTHTGGAPADPQSAALLLPSGPLGTLGVVGVAVLLGVAVWGLFSWLDPGMGPDVTVAAPTAPAPAAPARPTDTSPPATSQPLATPEAVVAVPAEVASTPAPDWEAVGPEVGRVVVDVRADRCGTRGPAGAGVVVDGDHVLTAAHLVEGASRIVIAQGPTTRAGRLVATDATADVALVRLSDALDGPGMGIVPALVDVDDALAVVVRTGPDDVGTARPGTVRELDLRVATRAGELDDVFTLRQVTDGIPAGAPVVTARGDLAGMALVDHVRRTRADTLHVVSGETLADLVASWGGSRPRALRTCPTPSPTPSPGPTPTPRGGPRATPPASPSPGEDAVPDPFVDDDTWVAVLETHRVADTTRAAMRRRVAAFDAQLQLPRRGIRTQLLRTGRSSSGSWLLYLGEWSRRADAVDACAAVRPVAPGCVASPLPR